MANSLNASLYLKNAAVVNEHVTLTWVLRLKRVQQHIWLYPVTESNDIFPMSFDFHIPCSCKLSACSGSFPITRHLRLAP